MRVFLSGHDKFRYFLRACSHSKPGKKCPNCQGELIAHPNGDWVVMPWRITETKTSEQIREYIDHNLKAEWNMHTGELKQVYFGRREEMDYMLNQ